jgi:hypothetical protein
MHDNKWAVVGLIIMSLLFWKDHKELNNEINGLSDQVVNLEYERNSYESALDQANLNIEDAQSYAWSSYDDMGYALDNLETVNP